MFRLGNESSNFNPPPSFFMTPTPVLYLRLTKHAKKQQFFVFHFTTLYIVGAHTCVMMPHIQNSALCKKKILASCTKKLPVFLGFCRCQHLRNSLLFAASHALSKPLSSPPGIFLPLVNPTLRGVGGWERNSPIN